MIPVLNRYYPRSSVGMLRMFTVPKYIRKNDIRPPVKSHCDAGLDRRLFAEKGSRLSGGTAPTQWVYKLLCQNR